MKNHYNSKYFFMGVILNVVGHFKLIVLSLILCFIGLWVKSCTYIGAGLLLIVLIISFIEQLFIKHGVETSDNPEMQDFLDLMNQENSSEKIRSWVDEKIQNSLVEEDSEEENEEN